MKSTDDNLKSIDTLFIRNETRSVFEIVRRIKNKIILTSPEFQRELVWSETEKSKLIESCLMRIPLPVIYMAENDDGDVIVVDGKQRLSTFFSFIENEFKITGLEKNKELNNKYFRDLKGNLQNRIEDTQLIIYTLDSRIEDEIKLDIFERVNSGKPVSKQEMRNCLYVGEATSLIKSMIENDLFSAMLGKHFENNIKRYKERRTVSEPMLDRLYANRFIAFQINGFESYYEDNMMDSFLADGLKKINRNPSASYEVLASFDRSMENCHLVFGTGAFRKIIGTKTKAINVGIFDVISFVYSKMHIRNQADVQKCKNIFISLLENEKFNKSISSATNTAYNIRTKFLIALDYYKEFL
jgi:hypothetical protein